MTRREMLVGLGGILATGTCPAVLNNVPLCRVGNLNTKPYDYEVEYLESTGTQTIPIPYNIGPNIKFSFKANWTGESVGVYKVRRWGNNSSSWECFIDATGGYFANGKIGSAHKIVIGQEYEYVFDLTSGALSLTQNGLVIKSSSGSYPTRDSMYLFGIRGGAGGSLDTFARCKLFWYKLWKDGVLMLDMIPVVKSGNGMMYDKVSEAFFENQGTGDFIVGPKI